LEAPGLNASNIYKLEAIITNGGLTTLLMPSALLLKTAKADQILQYVQDVYLVRGHATLYFVRLDHVAAPVIQKLF